MLERRGDSLARKTPENPLNSMKTKFTVLLTTLLVATDCFVFSSAAQQLIYQEGFNTDGEAASPQRYTTTGRAVFTVDQLDPVLLQAGPVYWAHNFEVPNSFVGLPSPTPARRAILAWDALITADAVSSQMQSVLTGTFKWLLNNKANAKVVILPSMTAAQYFADSLTAAGHTVSDYDASVAVTNFDLAIFAPGGDASRVVTAQVPVLTFSAADYDDLLVSTIGTPATFEAGPVTIVTGGHPAAGGQTGSFTGVTGSFTWQLLGDILPGGATTIASFVQTNLPSVQNLADVDAMVAGSKESNKNTGTVQSYDFSDGASGDWTADNAIPGGVTGTWGLVGKGKISVSAPGTYSFAIGVGDGGRLRIDKNQNGIGPEDNVIVRDATGAHAPYYGDVTFTNAGTFDFEVASFNAGGVGDIELSVSLQSGGNDRTAISSGSWELIGQTTGNVSLQGTINVTSYEPTGAPVLKSLPMLVLLNGPSDTPPGSVYGGGPMSGFEGAGFFAGSGLNKWAYPTDQTYRSLTLPPINVAGKSNVKLTVAFAATFLDFEHSGTIDYLDVLIDPDGSGPASLTQLIHFTAPTDADKFMDDRTTKPGSPTRLGLSFQDVTYDIPAGATDLVIEFQAATTYWNEIVAFDNVRVTEGVAVQPTLTASAGAGNAVAIAWPASAAGFVLQSSPALGSTANWTFVAGAPNPIAGAGSINVSTSSGNAAFYRLRK